MLDNLEAIVRRLWTNRSFVIAVLAVQTFFGAWYLLHGFNYYVEFVQQPPGSATLSRQLISALIATGLFDLVKIAEIVFGVLLLANRFVPLSVLGSLPINAIIIWINLILKADLDGIFVGTVIMLIHGFLVLAYFPYFKSSLAYRSSLWR
jgi:hypothetical protein